nr:MAG TPA: hypothetical protein [Caudoviricetes sp.]
MKIKEIIERVNALKDHAYDDETIKSFIEDCDKRIYREIIETHEQKEPVKPYLLRYPLDADDELLADDAYCQLYTFYALSQIDIFNGEIDRYTNNMICYNSALSDFKAYYNRTNRPLGSKRIITD